jgi:hypothetical protein
MLLATIITCLYGIVQYALSYKEGNFKVRDVGIVFVCSLGGLYGYDKYGGATTPTSFSQVFTEPPSF